LEATSNIPEAIQLSTIQSTQGATAAANVPFQVTNCANSKLNPKFTVTTNAKTSKAHSPSLTAKLT
jgi:hypothetical protein